MDGLVSVDVDKLIANGLAPFSVMIDSTLFYLRIDSGGRKTDRLLELGNELSSYDFFVIFVIFVDKSLSLIQ